MSKRIAILGSTGSIGRNALKVIAHLGAGYEVVGLSGHSRVEVLLEQARRFRPRFVGVSDPRAAGDWGGVGDKPSPQPSPGGRGSEALPRPRGDGVAAALRELGCELYVGSQGLREMVAHAEVDVVVAAVVGAAGVEAVLEAVRQGKRVALANKESLVVAGGVIMGEVRRRKERRQGERGRQGDKETRGQGEAVSSARPGGPLYLPQIIPVDSEHSAIFQAMHCGRLSEVKRVILTASGGPFRDVPLEQMERATPEQALKHPTWEMGSKITIDSATMFNKGLELIEARWLFNLRPDQIEVVIHPESIVHSMVEFVDGSVMAQLSPPDMRTPIQYALTYPERAPGIGRLIEFTRPLALNFEPVDPRRFPALRLGYDVAERGGTLGAVLNAANEAAVAAFLAGRIAFGRIFRVVELTMQSHRVQAGDTLDDLMEADRWAREKAADVIGKLD